MLAFIIITCFSFISKNAKNQDGKLDFVLHPDSSKNGSVVIDWSSYDYTDKVFKVYRSSNNVDYEMIPIDYTKITNVECLHVYPKTEIQNQLKDWMDQYGKDIIKVTPVFHDDFINNPTNYLQYSNNSWKYDVIVFGFWDKNNEKDLNQESAEKVREFINCGRGVIFGHDTFWKDTPTEGEYKTHEFFNSFSDLFNITIGNFNSPPSATKVYIAKTGILTQYPWPLETGKKFEVPITHTSNQSVNDLSNINFYLDGDYYKERPNLGYYLTTKDNVAFIQTGHSNGEATKDEQKIIANLIFASNQLVFSESTMNDYGCIDYAPPIAPTIRFMNHRFYFTSEDQGTTYSYYVESYDKDNTNKEAMLDRSSTKKYTITTGIQSYYYILDDTYRTTVSITNSIKAEKSYIASTYRTRYLHVASLDFSGNLSPTTTIETNLLTPTQNRALVRRFSQTTLRSYSYFILGGYSCK